MKFQRTNLVAAQIGDRAVAPMYYDCPTNSAVFEFRFEDKLMPELSPGDIVIMDNAQFHRKGALREIASRHHVPVLFLPNVINFRQKMWYTVAG